MAGYGFGGLAPTVPTVFESGDIPPITALGLRPDRLLECRGRRGTWSPPSDPGEALELYEKYVNNPASAAAFCAGHAGNVLYKPRVNDWLNRVLTDSDKVRRRDGTGEARRGRRRRPAAASCPSRGRSAGSRSARRPPVP